MGNNGRYYTKKDKYREKYFRVPKVLVYGEKYRKMKDRTRVAYAILLDRQELSLKNEWYDEEGRIYFIYSRKKLAEILMLSEKTVTQIRKELVELGLLEIRRMGQGLADRLYLLRPEVTDDDIYLIDKNEKDMEEEKAIPKSKNDDNENQEQENTAEFKEEKTPETLDNTEKGKNYTSRSVKFTPLEGKNLHPINTNINKNNKNETKNNLSILMEEIQNLDLHISIKKQLMINKDRLIDDSISIADIEQIYKAYENLITVNQFALILGNVLSLTKGPIKNITNIMMTAIKNFLSDLDQPKDRAYQHQKREVVPDWFIERKRKKAEREKRKAELVEKYDFTKNRDWIEPHAKKAPTLGELLKGEEFSIDKVLSLLEENDEASNL